MVKKKKASFKSNFYAPDIAEVELVFRSRVNPSARPKISNSKAAYDLLFNSWDKAKIDLLEQFKVVLVDNKCSSMGVATLSTGGSNACLVDLKHVFALALKANASGIIVSHNHPSGNFTPSESDKKLTAQFAAAAAILDIKLYDHIIVTRDGYMSFSDEGYIPSLCPTPS